MSKQRIEFNQRLSKPGLIVAPGVYEMVSLRLADRMGFDALYMTGYGTVASLLGLPDAGLATYTEMVGRVSAMAGMAKTPLIADGDTGYGGLLNVRHTIRGYEAAGAVAIQLEDQEFPKKCGHTPGRRVIPMEDMVKKLRLLLHLVAIQISKSLLAQMQELLLVWMRLCVVVRPTLVREQIFYLLSLPRRKRRCKNRTDISESSIDCEYG